MTQRGARPSTRVVALATMMVPLACSPGDGSSAPTLTSVAASAPTTESAPADTPIPTASADPPRPVEDVAEPLPDAKAIAAVITAAERAIRDPSLADEDVAAWGRSQQRAYQALARHPEWDDAVRGMLPADVIVGFDHIVEARTDPGLGRTAGTLKGTRIAANAGSGRHALRGFGDFRRVAVPVGNDPHGKAVGREDHLFVSERPGVANPCGERLDQQWMIVIGGHTNEFDSRRQ